MSRIKYKVLSQPVAMRIERYTPGMKSEWDTFVEKSKNGTFLLNRDYMEYHADRFPDHSYMFFDSDGNVSGLLPATLRGDVLSSHAGLTYGGIVMSMRTSAAEPLEMLTLLREQLRSEGIKKIIYKAIPHIYHRQGAEEDLYALFRLNARLTVRNLSTAINLRNPIPSSRLGKRAEKRRRKGNITVSEVQTADSFWDIVIEDRRIRHNTRPVHTAAELNYLKERFPDNILFYIATDPINEVLGGAVIYLDRGVIHLQYAACTQKGKDMYATDVIYHELIYNTLPDNDYFDFGISNEDAGRYLNEGMVHHKEEFGGRSVVYDIYEMDV
ncbi:MAG: GNAT family N-acetyltransferase [Bacteroides sp.]|nr:GNAT family N-acetyltransferase [Bacteroides sp.]